MEEKATSECEGKKTVSLEKSLRQCHADIVILKTKFRNIASQDQPSGTMAELVMELCHLQKREALAKDALEQAERSSAIAQAEMQVLFKSKEEVELQLACTRSNLRSLLSC